MQRFRTLFASALILIAACDKEPKAPVTVIQETNNLTSGPSATPVAPQPAAAASDAAAQEKYEAGVAHAFRCIAENKTKEGLAAFLEAQAAKPGDAYVKGEIERLQGITKAGDTAQKLLKEAQAVLDAGHPGEASQLCAKALSQFGDSDTADAFTMLKRQADALASTQIPENDKKTKFLKEAEEARAAKNYRAASSLTMPPLPAAPMWQYARRIMTPCGTSSQSMMNAAQMPRNSAKILTSSKMPF